MKTWVNYETANRYGKYTIIHYRVYCGYAYINIEDKWTVDGYIFNNNEGRGGSWSHIK